MQTRLGISLAFVVFSSFALLGCGSDTDGDDIGCTLEARSSVTVKVVDAIGTVVTDATVTFSIGGGAAENCEVFPDGLSYVCGYERDGNFTITATKGMDTKTATVTVNKTADGCHVEGQSITITLGA
jgi:hypothetical protein